MMICSFSHISQGVKKSTFFTECFKKSKEREKKIYNSVQDHLEFL